MWETSYIGIEGFRHNLPSVAFCNTADDPDGTLLATGELTGFTYVYVSITASPIKKAEPS
jgi:hypothetical protein